MTTINPNSSDRFRHPCGIPGEEGIVLRGTGELHQSQLHYKVIDNLLYFLFGYTPFSEIALCVDIEESRCAAERHSCPILLLYRGKVAEIQPLHSVMETGGWLRDIIAIDSPEHLQFLQGLYLFCHFLTLADAGISPSAADANAAAQQRAEGCTLVHLALDNQYAGFIALADELRDDAPATVRDIRAEGVRVALLTGDHEEAARHVAAALHLDDLRASCLPEDKLRWIEDRDREGRRVCMIGDGINDAPALKKAFVSVAMGGIGSDIAVDAADMALVRDDIRRLPHMLALSRRMMRVICINLTFSLVLNFAAIFLAMGGLLSPVAGALVHNAGSVLVIVHSALLLRWQEKNARKSTGRPLTSTGAGRNVNPSI